MRVDLTINSKPLFDRMEKGIKRFAYANVNAINNTAKRVQAGAREHLRETFTLRKSDFMLRQAAIIKPFASVKQGRAYAEISVGKRPRLLLGGFEEGADREPFTPGARRVAVPITGSPARPLFGAPVPPELQFKRLRFGEALGEGRVRRGAQRTYLIPEFGVFQRYGSEHEDTEPLFVFDSDARIQPVLDFLDGSQEIARVWFAEEEQREIIKALARNTRSIR